MKKISRVMTIFLSLLLLTVGFSATASAAAVSKPKPVSTISSTKSDVAIKLTWTKVSGASGYRLYQYKGSAWKAIYTGSGTSYKVSSLLPATTYKFAVKSYKKSGSKVLWSDIKKVSVKTSPVSDTSSLKAVVQKDTFKAALSWKAVGSAAGYRVEIFKGDKWTFLKNTTSLSYTASGLEPNTTYKFRVKTYKKISGKYYYSAGKTVSVKTPKLTVGKIVRTDYEAGSDRISLNWYGTGNITGYRVYIYNEVTKKYDVLATSSAAEYNRYGVQPYNIYGLQPYKDYSIVIKPYAKAGTSILWGDKYSLKVKTKMAGVGNLRATINGNDVTVFWDKSEGAQYYTVYAYDSKSKEYEIKEDYLSENYYTFTLSEGEVVKLAVEGFAENGDQTIYGEREYLTVGGTYKYKKIFASGEFSYNTYFDDSKDPCTIYIKNGNVKMTTTMNLEDITAKCEFVYNAKTKKSIMLVKVTDYVGFYTNDIDKISGGDVSLDDFTSFSNRFNDEISGEISVTQANVGGKKLVCESYTNSKGEVVCYYFENGALVANSITAGGYTDYMDVYSVKSKVTESFSTTPPLSYIDISSIL